jgi:O-antigen ligase
MIAKLRSSFDIGALPNLARLLLLAIIAICGTVTLPQRLQVGPVTGLALLSIGFCTTAWVLWLAKPWFPLDRWPMLVPMLLFTVYSIGSMLWFAPTEKGLQVLAVMVGFFGIMLLTARETELKPRIAFEIYRLLDWGLLFSSVVYLASVPTHGAGNDQYIMARAYALFAIFGVARQLAAWRSGDWRGFWFAAAITAVLVISVSRTAMVAAMLMFPLAALSRMDRKGVLQAVGMALAGAGTMALLLMFSPMMRERFFGLDASMHVGGVAINASGRSEMWAMLLRDSVDSRWCGKGVGSSSLLIDRFFPGLGHPHNDYIRVLYDYGIVGLACFIAFMLGTITTLFSQVRQFIEMGPKGNVRLQYFLTPALSIIGVASGMATDNLMCYTFVMAPFALLLGCALGLSPRQEAGLARPARVLARREVAALPSRPKRPRRGGLVPSAGVESKSPDSARGAA